MKKFVVLTALLLSVVSVSLAGITLKGKVVDAKTQKLSRELT